MLWQEKKGFLCTVFRKHSVRVRTERPPGGLACGPPPAEPAAPRSCSGRILLLLLSNTDSPGDVTVQTARPGHEQPCAPPRPLQGAFWGSELTRDSLTCPGLPCCRGAQAGPGKGHTEEGTRGHPQLCQPPRPGHREAPENRCRLQHDGTRCHRTATSRGPTRGPSSQGQVTTGLERRVQWFLQAAKLWSRSLCSDTRPGHTASEENNW